MRLDPQDSNELPCKSNVPLQLKEAMCHSSAELQVEVYQYLCRGGHLGDTYALSLLHNWFTGVDSPEVP